MYVLLWGKSFQFFIHSLLTQASEQMYVFAPEHSGANRNYFTLYFHKKIDYFFTFLI
jgi:hypothetical protein